MRSNDNRSTKPPSNAHRFGSGADPVAAGRKGGLARLKATTPEERAEMSRKAVAARIEKNKKRLLRISGHAIEALYDTVTDKKHPSRVGAAKAILDRSGFGPKSSIEIDGEISGELIHRTQCLDVDKLPMIVKWMMAASIESGWEPSPELIVKVRAELPMLQIKVESSKPDNRSITNGNTNASGTGNAIGAGHAIDHSINRAITAGAVAVAARHQGEDQDEADDGDDTDQDDGDTN
jgi:hypothetical protein